MNGHDDAAADAALLSQAVGRPVRVQWTRQDEHGWDPKGPPQLLELDGAVDGDGRIAALAHRDVAPEGDGEPAEHAAARARRRRASRSRRGSRPA